MAALADRVLPARPGLHPGLTRVLAREPGAPDRLTCGIELRRA